MIEFYCPSCGKKYHLEDRFFGLRVRCSMCNSKYYIGKRGDGSGDTSIPVVPVSLSQMSQPAAAAPRLAEDASSVVQSAEPPASKRVCVPSPASASPVRIVVSEGLVSPQAGNVASGVGACSGQASGAHHDVDSDSPGVGGKTGEQGGEGDVSEDSVELSGDWRRLFARNLDLLIFCFALAKLLQMLTVLFNCPGFNDSLLTWPGMVSNSIQTFCALLLEVGVYSLLGTTPGKWLLGVAIVDGNCQPLDGKTYFKRNLLVFALGLGLGVPFLTPFAMAYQSQRMKQGKKPSYDETLGTQAIIKGRNFFKSLLGFILFIALLIMLVMLQRDDVPQGLWSKEKNRENIERIFP